jgi:hypothetical protein
LKNSRGLARAAVRAIGYPELGAMRIAGFLLLLAGWGIVLSAIALLGSPSPMAGFVTAGTGVEVMGLVLVIRSHRLPRRERR